VPSSSPSGAGGAVVVDVLALLLGRWHFFAIPVEIDDDDDARVWDKHDSTDSLRVNSVNFTLLGVDGRGDGDVDLDDDPLLCPISAKFNLHVNSSMASIAPPLALCALRNAVDTVMTFVASSKLIPRHSIV
jgi:hypothetical protein